MRTLQKAGGIAALIESGTFIFGFALLATVLGPLFQGDLDGTETVRFLAAHETLYYVWNLVIYVLFGAMLVVLSLSLQERLKEPSRALMPIATAFGLIWAGLVIASGMVANVGAATVIEIAARDAAEAATVWAAVDTVSDGLGGGNEIVGGIWVSLVSLVGLQGGKLPRALNYVGLLSGVAGIVTVVPALTDLGALFGIGLIVWFIWAGITLLKSAPRENQQ